MTRGTMPRFASLSPPHPTQVRPPNSGRVASVATWVATREIDKLQALTTKKKARHHPPVGHHYRTFAATNPPRHLVRSVGNRDALVRTSPFPTLQGRPMPDATLTL